MSKALFLSYHGLGAQSARAYRLLGLLPLPHFDVDLASVMLDMGKVDAVELLEDLVDASLLEVDETDRYQFHDLIRLHARQCAEQGEDQEARDAVLVAVLDHYVYRAADVYRTVMPLEWRAGPVYEQLQNERSPHSGSSEALDSLEPALPNLMAVLRSGVDNRHDELVWQLCEGLWPLFLYRKHYADWIQTYLWGIDAAGRCRNDVALSRMHHHLGLAFHNLRRCDDAAEQGRLALDAARAAGHRPAESGARSLIGMTHRASGRVVEAITIFRGLIEFDRNEGLLRSEALNHRCLGQALIEVGEFDEAIAELRDGREQAAALPDPIVEAMTTVWLADALSRAGQSTQAAGLVQEISPTVHGEGSSQYTGLLLMVQGEIAQRQRDHDLARSCLTQARDLFTDIGAPIVQRVQLALADLDRTPENE